MGCTHALPSANWSREFDRVFLKAIESRSNCWGHLQVSNGKNPKILVAPILIIWRVFLPDFLSKDEPPETMVKSGRGFTQKPGGFSILAYQGEGIAEFSIPRLSS